MAGPYSAGSIFLQIVPSFKGVPEAIAAEAKTWEKVAAQGGTDGGKGYAKAFEKEISKDIPAAIGKATTDSNGSTEKAGKDAGKKYSGAFQESIRQAVRDAQREVQATIKVTADDDDVKRTLAAIGGELKALGKAKIGVNMSAEDAYATLATIEELLKHVQDEAGRLDLEVNAGAATAAIEKIRERIDSLSHTDVTPNIKADDRQLSAFETKVRSALQAALRDLPVVDVNADTTGAEAQLGALRSVMAELSDARIGVEVDAATARAVLADIETELEHLQRDGATIDVRFNAAAAMEKIAALKTELDAIAHPTVEPEVKVKQSGAFERSIKDAISGALKDLPEIDLRADGSAADQEIVRIRGELEALSNKTIGVDITDSEAVLKLGELQARLEQLTSEHWGAQVDADTMAAARKLDSVLKTMEEIAGKRPTVAVDAETAMADAKLLATLGFVRDLEREKVIRAQVNVDGAAAAAAELEAVGRAGRNSAIGGQDGANAFRAFNGYLLAGATIGPTIVPALATAGAAAAAMGPLALAGAAGIGVLAMSMSGIGAAVKAMGAAQKSAASDQLAYDKGVQSSTNAMISAQEGLDNARRNAGRAAEDSARAVASAVLSEQTAEEHAAQTAIRDNEAVATAVEGAAKARETAARSAVTANRQVETADRGVTTAEQSLQRAQEDAKRAQEDLTRAREDAVKSERDLRLQIEGGAIAYQQALLDVTDAEATLAKVRADPKSTVEDIQRATLALAEQKLQVQELANRNTDMAEQQAKWTASGVDGSDQVVAAQRRVQSATQSVGNAQQALADAQRAAADARVQRDQQAMDSQRAIADADRQVADAERQRAQDQIDSQRGIAQAQQQVAVAREQQQRAAADGQQAISDAQRALAQAQLAYQDSLQKTTASQRNLNDAMAQLGPAGQAFAQYIYGYLLPAFHELRDVAAEGFLPGFQSWIDTIVGHYGPQLIQITGAMSQAMGGMFQQFGNALLTKPFADLFDMLQTDGPNFIGMMGSVLTNLGSGTASLIVALKPLAYLFGDWLVQATSAFKNWAANLGASSGLQSFLGYVREVAPVVGEFFKNLAGAVLNLATGLAPYAAALLNVFSGILGFIAGMDPALLGRIAVSILAIVSAVQGLFGLTAAFKSVESAVALAGVATDKFGVSIGKMFGGVGMLAAGIVTLYLNSQTFRDTVSGIVSFLGDFLGWVKGAMPWLTTLGGVLLNIGGGFAVFKGIAGIMGSLGSAMENTAPKVGAMASMLTQNETAGSRVEGVIGKVGKAFGSLGFALPLIGAAIGLVSSYFDAQQQKIDDLASGYQGWYEAMGRGGSGAQEAAAKLQGLADRMSDLRSKMVEAKAAMDAASPMDTPGGAGLDAANNSAKAATKSYNDLVEASKKAQQEWDNELAKMAPVERAQALLNVAIAQHGANSDQARAATDAYKGAVDANRVAQDNAAWSIDGVNNALIRQNDILIAGAQSELAYQQSVDNLADAHKRSQDALAQYGAGSDQYRRALLAEQVQSLQTAQAAGEHEKSLHQNSSTAVQNSLSQAALYLELERQKSIYGELPPAQEQMRAALERSTSQADIAKVRFDNLGLAVVGIPDDKTIDVASTSPEVEKQLTDLGVHVQHMPDGTVRLTGDTKAAEDLLNFTARDRKSTVWQDVKMMSMDQANSSFGANLGHDMNAGYAYGGYTGPGHRFQPAGIVHAGEFVVPKPIVDSMGVGNVARAVGFPGYANGGLVASVGMPGYAGGGLVANWGGTIDLTGGDVSPLAQIWALAIRDVTSLSGLAAQSVARSFGAMRDGALGATGQLNAGIAGQWGQIAGVINAGAINAQNGATGQFRILQANATSIFGQMQNAIPASWNAMGDRLNAKTVDTQVRQVGWFSSLRDSLGVITGQTRDIVTVNWNTMGDNANTKTVDTQVRQVGWFTGLRDNLNVLTSQTRDIVTANWNRMGDNANAKTVDTQVRQVGWFSSLRDSLSGITGQTRDIVTVNWNTMGNNLDWKTGDTSRIVQTTWTGMGANVTQNTRDTVNNVGRAFAGIQPAAQNPVNFVVNTVLNQGLFPAFNAVSAAVSMPNVIQSIAFRPQATNNTPIYAAAGGQVPGWSPHDKADNIPAWLTAGEFVQPVQTVNHYGTDIMDAIRKRQIPKEALARLRYADGGYVGPRQNYAAGGFTWPELDNIRKKMFPGSVLTSAYRPGANDYHGLGEAIDIGWAGNDQKHLMPIAAALAQTFPNATELIHNPNGSIKNGMKVPPSFWGAATWAAHANHVHFAMTPQALGGAPGGGVAGSIFNPMLAGKWASADDVHAYLANSFAASNAAMTGGPLKNALHGVAPKDLQIGWDGAIGNGVRNWFAQAAAMASSNSTDPAPVAPGPVQDQTRAVFGQYGWNAGPQWDATSWIVGKESGWNPRAQNPVSTASGLFQQIDGTWRAYRPPSAAGYAHMKDAPVPLQAGAGAAYIRARYGSPIAARAYWQAHGNYARGGLVMPELHDAGLGGVIHPGLNMIVNKTRKAEASVSMDTIDNLRTIAEGGQVPLIGSVTLPIMPTATPDEIAGAILHTATVAKRGGKW